MKLSNLFRGFGKKDRITNDMVIERINDAINEITKVQEEIQANCKFGDMWFEAKTEASDNLNRAHKAEVKLAEANKDIEYKTAQIEEMKKTYFKRETIRADRTKGSQKIGVKSRAVQSNIISKVKGG